MRPNPTVLFAVLAFTAGCQGTFSMQDDDRFMMPDDDTGVIPTPSCPVDPDCGTIGTCDQYVCPDYFICEDEADGSKLCIGPGPDYPDDGGGWTCEDVEQDGTTVTQCRRPGGTLPDDGGGAGWACELQAEFVVCTDNTPNFPDDGGGEVYDCYYRNEFRICESGGTPGDGGSWNCYDTVTGRECRNNGFTYPDDREWTCFDDASGTVCQTPGSDLPDDGGGSGWVCEVNAELVVCRDGSPDYPDDGGGEAWDCTFGDEFRLCDDTPGDGGSDVCVPGQQRWCDDAVFCSWGKQTCNPDGNWGPCVEPSVSASGIADRPANECGCRFFYFNGGCCEDQADRNGDGAPDCIIPADHAPPACTTDGSLCSMCDSQQDCGGGDICVFRRDGYAFCGQDCSTTACPAGYTCQALGTSTGTFNQCVPNSGSCE